MTGHPWDAWPCRVEHYDSRESWLDARRTMIGASETAGLFGVGYENQSPVTIWMDKCGYPQTEPHADTLRRMERGRKIEPVVADEFRAETGLEVYDPGRWTICRCADREWLGASLDRVALHPEYGPVPVELKVVSGRLWRDWDYACEPPLKYMVQVQHQMAVTGAAAAYLVALVGGDDLVIRLVRRHDGFIAAVLTRLEKFWACVQDRRMPPVDRSEATRLALGAIWPTDSGDEVMLPAEAVEWDRDLIRAKERRKAIDEEITGLENRIKASIGEAAIGRLPGEGAYSWKHQHRAGYTVAPADFRVLRRMGK